MKLSGYLILPGICFPGILFAQILLGGKALDRETRTPVPYVNVTVKEANTFGTATNAEGEFTISVKQLPATLVFSHVAYDKKEVVMVTTSESEVVVLSPATTQLNELTVNSDDAGKIVSAAYEKLSGATAAMMAKGFYRQVTKCDDFYSELIEMFSTSRIDARGIGVSKVEDGRAAARSNMEKGYVVYQNFSAFTNTLPLVQIKERAFYMPLRKDSDSLYRFSLKERIKHKRPAGEIYVIEFVPNSGLDKPAFQGRLYIDDHNNLIQLKAFISDPRFNPLRGVGDPKNVSGIRLEVDVFCDTRRDSTILLQSAKVDLFFKFQYEQNVWRDIHTSSFYFVYNTTPAVDSLALEVRNENDYQAIKGAVHDDSHWEKNSVLARTPIEREIIKQFRESKLFRQLFETK